jgi:hypothetical protein
MLQRFGHEVRVAVCGHVDEINLPAKKIFEGHEQTKEPVGRVYVSPPPEDGQKIEVACGWIEIISGGGAKEIEARNFKAIANRFKLLAMLVE